MTQFPPPAQPAPPSPGPPQPRKSKKTLLFVLLGIGVAVLACCGGTTVIALNSSDKPSGQTTGADNLTSDLPAPASTQPAATTKAAPAEATVGSPVRDGKFEFVVKKLECGRPKVGGEYLNKTAQGQYCLVSMSVKNIGNKPQQFSDSDQKAFSDKGAQFAPDSAASLYANDDQQVWLNEINPGNTLTGTIVFDIPKDAKIVRLELHDSAFSGGVKVRVA